MAFKQIWNAGHGYNTPGKRSPDGMREYEFNRAVANYCKQFTDERYVGVKSIFTHSDSRDVPLNERTDLANKIGADCYTSIHANASGTGWNIANGIETYVHPLRTTKENALAIQVQRELIAATNLTNRGVKVADFHELRETKMVAILLELGFMTNRNDAKLLRSETYRKTVAEAIVRAHAKFFGWQRKTLVMAATTENLKEEDVDIMSQKFEPTVGAINDSVKTVLARFEQKDPALAKTWRAKFDKGELTISDAVGLLYVAVERGYITGKIN
jgi:N-acetylmuramoyl-L-alanine amidase